MSRLNFTTDRFRLMRGKSPLLPTWGQCTVTSSGQWSLPCAHFHGFLARMYLASV